MTSSSLFTLDHNLDLEEGVIKHKNIKNLETKSCSNLGKLKNYIK